MNAVRYLALLSLLLVSTSATSANTLLENLTSQLGVTTEQAAGGAGALFDLAKRRLPGEEFSRIAAVVPEIDNLIEGAPLWNEKTASAAASMLGGEGALADLATLAVSFAELGLSSEMIGRFTPILLDYLQKMGGSDVMELMKTVVAFPQ